MAIFRYEVEEVAEHLIHINADLLLLCHAARHPIRQHLRVRVAITLLIKTGVGRWAVESRSDSARRLFPPIQPKSIYPASD